MLKPTRQSRPRWQQRRKYSPWQRQREIFATTTRLGLMLWWDRLWHQGDPVVYGRQAQWLVQELLDLGPTFIKIGQAMSTRPDLIPLEYIQELSQLQDRVPPFSSSEAIAVIEEELGQTLNSAYREFKTTPLASASLGQVHRAKLHSGEEVVVKVQRPGLRALLDLDFQVLKRQITLLNRLVPGVRKYKLQDIYREFFELLYQEIDYIHEGENAERFGKNFQGDSQVIVPKIFWSHTTTKVLTMEYVPGIKIDDRQSLEAQRIDTDHVIRLGICSYLQQLLLDGFFQSDPHPGNMAVNPDGKLIFYDFGTMTEVQAIAKDQMIQAFFAVLRKDTDEVVETLIYMGLIEPMSDLTPVKRLVAFLLERFRDKPIDIRAFEQLSSEIYSMFEQQPFRLPPQMTFIIKSLTTLDGIARALDPQYNLLAAAQPFIKDLTLRDRQGGLLGSLAAQAKSYLIYRLKQPSKTELAIRSLEARIETGELQFQTRNVQSDRQMRRLYLALKTLIYSCTTGFSLIVGILLLGNAVNWAIFALGWASFFGLLLLKSFVRLMMQEKIDRLAH